MVFDKSNTTIFCFFFVHTVGPPYFKERTRMAWNACTKQQASWVCSHSPGLHSASLLLSLSLCELQCTNQEQKRWGINRSWRTKCATKSRSHTTARSHTHMPCDVSPDPPLQKISCAAHLHCCHTTVHITLQKIYSDVNLLWKSRNWNIIKVTLMSH